VSQTFQITWVGQNPPREYNYKGKDYKEYVVALNDYAGAKTVKTSYFADEEPPRAGDEVFGHVEVREFGEGEDAWTKHTFKRERAEQGRPPSFKKAGANGAGAPIATQDDRSRRIERQHSQEMAIRALALYPAANENDLRGKIKDWTDWFVADLDAPQAPPAQDKPVIEDVTPARAGTPISDDDSVPF
jgi:hypothetical protein